MKRIVLVALLLVAAAPAQERVKSVTFHCEPEDARVFLETSGTSPYLLGECNQSIPLDLGIFDGRRAVSITFRRPGWLDETRVLQQTGSESRYFANRERYPDATQGPVRLTARADLGSRVIQIGFFLRHHWLSLLALGAVALGGLMHWRRLHQGHQRALTLDKMQAGAEGPDPLLMKILGGYRLVERIGTGGMASVYRAIPQDSLDESQAVAVKVMHPHFVSDPVSRGRFRREVEIYRDLSHRHILRLLDFGEQDGLLFLVLELLRGQSLRDVLGRGKRLSLAQVLEYAGPLAEAIDYAHQKDIVHRDLKPENIFLTQEGRLVVMDFGIARGGEYTQHTATGQALGTPEYMAPEQVQGRSETASDLYSLGVILFEMLSGEVPFRGDDPMAVAFMHVGQQPPVLTDQPPQVAAAVGRLLAKDPKKRYATASQAVEALR